MKYTDLSIKHIINFLEKHTQSILLIILCAAIVQSTSYIPYVNILFVREFRWAVILLTTFLLFKVRGKDAFRVAVVLFVICLFLSFTKQEDLRESITNLIYVLLWYGVIKEIGHIRRENHMVE